MTSSIPTVVDALTETYTALPAAGTSKRGPAEAGALILDVVNGKIHRFYKWLNATAQVIGDAIYWDLANSVGYEANKLGSGTTGIDLLAGVALGAPAQNSYAWVQIFGPNTATNVEGTTDIAIGNSLKGSSGNLYLIKDAAIATEPTYANRARALAAYTTDSAAATGSVFLSALSF